MTRSEREKAAYQEREAERQMERQLRRPPSHIRAMRRRVATRARALEQHARLVYDTDRDIAGEFGNE